MKVFVGLSGGVDSAVAAALLLREGHEVHGVFVKIWQPAFSECSWREDRLDALRSAAALHIPLHEVDLSETYQSEVVADMVERYRAGLTPNPDALCNRAVKFGALAQWARERGAECVATGHYARIRHDDTGPQLLRGVDPEKDQSYFLYLLSSGDLARAAFPVGSLRKSEVRAHARELGLPVAGKRDSQGLCFIGSVSVKDFLSRELDLRPGPVLDAEGRVIGEHGGAALYTIGERHGLRLNPGLPSAPLYVIATDVRANTVIVSPRREDAAVAEARIAEPHWINSAPEMPFSCCAQMRHRGECVPAAVRASGDGLIVSFAQPQIAPLGQSLVLYDGDRVLGGGAISNGDSNGDSPLHV